MLDLHPEKLLELEFEYARETMEQASADRRKVVEFYVLVAGGLSSIALALVQLDANRTPSIANLDSVIGASGRMPSIVYSLIFWTIGLAGFFTLLHLIRLRQASHDSIRAMSRIKDLYLKRYPALSEALVWRADTVPSLSRPGSITFNMGLFVVLLDSMAFAAGVVFLDFKSAIPLTTLAAALGLLALLWQAFIYFWMLREK